MIIPQSRLQAHLNVYSLGAVLSVIVTSVALAWVLWYSGNGLDFTDEGYYLLWIASPFSYGATATNFGFVYNPIYLLLGEDIASLRRFSVLVTYGLAWTLCDLFFRVLFKKDLVRRGGRLIVSSAVAAASLTQLDWWISSPSYNTLAFQALLLSAIGLLLADRWVSRGSVVGWILLGVGGWLAFMAKPTTAVAFAGCAAVYLTLTKRANIFLGLLSLGIAGGFLALSAFAIDGSVGAFFARIESGAALTQMLDSSHALRNILRVDSFRFGGGERALLLIGLSMALLAICSQYMQSRVMGYCAEMLFFVIPLSALGVIFRGLDLPLAAATSQGRTLSLLVIIFSTFIIRIVFEGGRGLKSVTVRQWGVALMFLMLPHIYAFGTNNNYWHTGARAGFFWVLSGLVFINPLTFGSRLSKLLLLLAILIQLIVVVVVGVGMKEPYRQPSPLWENNYKVLIGGGGLTLDKDFGKYILEVRASAKDAGFKVGMPVLDLSGQSPGLLYAIGAHGVGLPWIIGGYPGSNSFAATVFQKVSCQELAVAWLLTEPSGPRRISQDLLSTWGGKLEDYQMVGSFETPEGAGGYKQARRQYLLKPIRSVGAAITACVAVRSAEQL